MIASRRIDHSDALPQIPVEDLQSVAGYTWAGLRGIAGLFFDFDGFAGLSGKIGIKAFQALSMNRQGQKRKNEGEDEIFHELLYTDVGAEVEFFLIFEILGMINEKP